MASETSIDRYCRILHDAYEEAATDNGWETNPESRKSWEEVPEANKKTMRAAVRVLVNTIEDELY